MDLVKKVGKGCHSQETCRIYRTSLDCHIASPLAKGAAAIWRSCCCHNCSWASILSAVGMDGLRSSVSVLAPNTCDLDLLAATGSIFAGGIDRVGFDGVGSLVGAGVVFDVPARRVKKLKADFLGGAMSPSISM